jgi:AcrR family transcriptional regulator
MAPGTTRDGEPERAPVGSSEWWEGQGRQREPLSRARIVEAALRVLEAEGADAVTMRRLAQELGAAPASLYRHVESREALMLLVGEAILADVRLDDHPPGASWQERTTVYAYALRRAVGRSRGRATFVVGPNTPAPEAYALFQQGVQVYLDAGFPPEVAHAAVQAVVFVVLSFADLESQWDDALVVEPGSLLADGVDRAGRPDAAPNDEMFDFLLGSVIEGIARRVAP